MKIKSLALKQLDKQLELWIKAKANFQPRTGWISCIRHALGMTLPQLAKRLGVSRSRVIKIQQSELTGALTLHTLKDVADKLNCDLVYAFVPRRPLKMLLRQRAEIIAKQKLQKVSHSMALEAQAVEGVQQQEQFDELVNMLLASSLKRLWDETE